MRVKVEWDGNKLLPPQMMYQKDSGWLSSTKECNQVFDDDFVSKFEMLNESMNIQLMPHLFLEQLTSMELSFVQEKRMVINCSFCN